MNISSSSGTTAVSGSGSSTTSSKTSSSKNSSSTSFDEELKNVSNSEETQETENSSDAENASKTEKNSEDNKTQKKDEQSSDDKNKEDNTQLKGEVSKNDLLTSEELLAQNIQAMMNNRGLTSQTQYQRLNIANFSELSQTLTAQIDYSTIDMDVNDALFFSNLAQNTDMSMKSVAAEIANLAENNTQQAQKTANVSATLMNALSEGLKTNQPFRINFDKDISVIIKINKDGTIAANFIPGDKAVEEYLKMNISTLRQRFDQQELPYSDLSYSRSKRDQQEGNRRNNKENDHE